MAKEAFCPEHGPYDASLRACPYPHAGGAPTGISMSDEDEVPTDLGYSGGGTGPTMPPGGYSDEGETEPPAGYGAGAGLNMGQEPPTDPPMQAQRNDVTELEVVTKGTLGTLWVKNGPRRGHMYPIKHGTTIGRKGADLILDDPKVSASHARFTMEDEEFVIWDFGSSNGTLVNEKRIREATVLRENDEIKIGETTFLVKLLDPRPKARPASPSRRAKKTG